MFFVLILRINFSFFKQVSEKMAILRLACGNYLKIPVRRLKNAAKKVSEKPAKERIKLPKNFAEQPLKIENDFVLERQKREQLTLAEVQQVNSGQKQLNWDFLDLANRKKFGVEDYARYSGQHKQQGRI